MIAALLLLGVCAQPPVFNVDELPACSDTVTTGCHLDCTPEREDVECGCGEWISWIFSPDPPPAEWAVIRRCTVSTGDCWEVGSTRLLNRPEWTDEDGVVHPRIQVTLWYTAWDVPFPREGTAYDYWVAPCRALPDLSETCGPFSLNSRYRAAPYACFEDGREVACYVGDPVATR